MEKLMSADFWPQVENWFKRVMGDVVRREVKNALKEEMEKKQPPRMYTREEVAKMAHITLATLWSKTKSGLITPTHLGRRVLYSEDEVNRFLSK